MAVFAHGVGQVRFMQRRPGCCQRRESHSLSAPRSTPGCIRCTFFVLLFRCNSFSPQYRKNKGNIQAVNSRELVQKNGRIRAGVEVMCPDRSPVFCFVPLPERSSICFLTIIKEAPCGASVPVFQYHGNRDNCSSIPCVPDAKILNHLISPTIISILHFEKAFCRSIILS